MQRWENYPFNLLVAVRGKTRLELPGKLTRDVWAGIRYALSSLNEQEKQVVEYRYVQGRTQTETGEQMGLTQEQIRKIENQTAQKLRIPSRWCYMQYGIDGYLKKKSDDAYAEGYSRGYKKGYELGREDANSDVLPECVPDEVLNRSVETLNLSARASNCLARAGCERIRDVTAIPENRIMVIRNLGRKTADEIARALDKLEIDSDWKFFLI